MPAIKRPRDVIDRKALTAKLDDLAGWSGYSPSAHGDVLAVFKEAYQSGFAEFRRRFEAGEELGPEAIRTHAFLMDQLIRSVHDFADRWVYPAANPTTSEVLCIAATGGYGRGQLAPYSDIDLMFIHPYKLAPRTEQLVEFCLYMLWDLGLKVGHATRSVEEAVRLAKEDLTIRTSLLEARWLWGDQALFDTFKAAFWTDVVDGSGMTFVDQKLAERDGRHDKMGDSRYVLEPNLKEGKGGLRDAQTLLWIGKYLYKAEDMRDLQKQGLLSSRDVKAFAKAETFLWSVRCHLHFLVGRPEERLTFNVQTELAERLGYNDRAGSRGVERFMKHFFLVAKDVGDLTRILCAVLEERQKKASKKFRLPSFGFGKKGLPDGFRIEAGRLDMADEHVFENDPVKLIELFHLAQQTGMDMHPNALRLVTRNLKRVNTDLRNDPEANRMFVEMLYGDNPETTLMRFNEAGVFGKFIPDFGRVVAQMQYDMYHVYTVDEHTIRAIGLLKGIETGRLGEDHPVSCEVIPEVQSLRVLYVAVLLHDIAKGRGGDHSVLGAKVARKLCPRFGLNDWETETVEWLVLHHLLMSHTAFKRDLDDPKTIEDFAKMVQSPERLRLLLILTVADIRAVGPNVWNEWKAGLLRELYWQTQALLSGELPAERRAKRIERAQALLASTLEAAGWSSPEIEDHVALGPPSYWLGQDEASHIRNAHLVHRAAADGVDLLIESFVEENTAATGVTIYTADHPGLFANIAGALALAGASVVDAKIVTLADGMALDTFQILDAKGKAITDPGHLERLEARIEDALRGTRRPEKDLKKARSDQLPSKIKMFKVPSRVLIDNQASNSHTVIEINGKDQPEFLYRVTSALTAEGLQIASARIATYGERAVDVFYVKDAFGLKVLDKQKIETIRERLIATIGGEDGDAAARNVKKKASARKTGRKTGQKTGEKRTPAKGVAKVSPKPKPTPNPTPNPTRAAE